MRSHGTARGFWSTRSVNTAVLLKSGATCAATATVATRSGAKNVTAGRAEVYSRRNINRAFYSLLTQK